MNSWEFAEGRYGTFEEKVCVMDEIKICLSCGLDTITNYKGGKRCNNCGYFKLNCEE